MVGGLSLWDDGALQTVELDNLTGMDAGWMGTALSFDDLSLTVTFADLSTQTIAASTSYLPGYWTYSPDSINTNQWSWNSPTDASDPGMIISAVLQGTITPTVFTLGDGHTVFISTGTLIATLDASDHTSFFDPNSFNYGFYVSNPADITATDVSNAPTPTPEPGAISLLVGPLVLLLGRRFRK